MGVALAQVDSRGVEIINVRSPERREHAHGCMGTSLVSVCHQNHVGREEDHRTIWFAQQVNSTDP